MYNVTTYYMGVAKGQVWTLNKKFEDRQEALNHIDEEIEQWDTIKVVCPEMNLDEPGDWQ